MEYVLKSPKIEDAALRGLLAFIASQPFVCVKVLDRAGRVIAVSSTGLRLLETDVTVILGKVWTAFWTGEYQQKALDAVASAFDGGSAGFTGRYFGTSEPTDWRVEAMPLERQGDHVETIAVVSTLIPSGASSPDLSAQQESMREVLHKLRNVAATSKSAGRLILRDLPKDTMDQIANDLSDAGQEAEEALLRFEKMMGLTVNKTSRPH